MGLKELIEHIGNYKITAEFDNGKQLIDNIHNINPDLIIMDLTMPVMDGHATMKWLKDNEIDYHPVLILTLDTSNSAIIELYQAGVRGYLPKTCTAETLKKAIEDILNDGYHYNDMLNNALLQSNKPQPKNAREMLSKLSDRELEFIRLVCDKEEYTYERIAEILSVHRRTVDNYRDALFRKFDIKSKTGLVMFAIKYGVITV